MRATALPKPESLVQRNSIAQADAIRALLVAVAISVWVVYNVVLPPVFVCPYAGWLTRPNQSRGRAGARPTNFSSTRGAHECKRELTAQVAGAIFGALPLSYRRITPGRTRTCDHPVNQPYVRSPGRGTAMQLHYQRSIDVSIPDATTFGITKISTTTASSGTGPSSSQELRYALSARQIHFPCCPPIGTRPAKMHDGFSIIDNSRDIVNSVVLQPLIL